MDAFTLSALLTLDDSKFNSSLSQSEGKFKGFGSLIATGAKAIAGAQMVKGIVDFGVESVRVGQQFDSAMSQVAATMGVTTESIGDLRTFAQEMGAKTAFSATQAAEALNYMALAGYDAETSMNMLPNVLNLAAAGGMDLARASDMITDASSALGLSLDETTLMVDMMAKTASKSNTSVSQLGEAILTVGGTAKNMAGGTTELNAALGILADNGIKGAEGGTALRNVILSLSAPTDKAAAKMKELGLNVYDAKGNMRGLPDIFNDLNKALSKMTQGERTQVLNELFNKVDLKSVNALLGTNVERWEDLFNAIDGSWYTIDSLTTAIENNGGSLDAMKSNLENIGVTAEEFDAALAASKGNAEEFAKQLQASADNGKTLEDVAETLGISLEDLQKAFDETTGAAEEMANTQLDNLDGEITLLKSAIEGAKIAVSDVLTPAIRDMVKFGTSAVQDLTKAFQEEGLSGAAKEAGKIFDTLAEDIGKAFDDTFKAITEMDWLQLGTDVFNWVVGAFEGIAGWFSDRFAAAKSAIAAVDWMQAGKDLLAKVGEGLAGIADWAKEKFKAATEGIKSVDWKSAGAAVVTLVGEGITAVADWFKTWFLPGPGGITAVDWAGAGKAILTAIETAFGAVADFFKGLFEAGVTGIASVDWGQVSSDILSKVGTGLGEIANWFKTKFEAATAGIKSVDWKQAGADLIQAVGNGITAIADTFKAWFDPATGGIASVDWKGAGTAILTAIGTAFGAIVEFFTGLFTNAPSGITAAGVDWAGAGKAILTAVGTAFSSIGDWIRPLFEPAVTALKEINWGEIGTDILTKVATNLSTLTADLTKFFNDAATEIKKIDWVSVGSNIKGKIESTLGAIQDWTVKTFQKIINDVDGLSWTDLGTAIYGYIEAGLSAIDGLLTGLFGDEWTQVKEDAETTWAVISTVFSTTFETIKTSWQNIKTLFTVTIPGVWNFVKTTAETTWNNIKSAITDVINSITEPITSFVDTIKGAIDKVLEFLGLKPSDTKDWNGEVQSKLTDPMNSAAESIVYVIDEMGNLTAMDGKNLATTTSTHVHTEKTVYSTEYDSDYRNDKGAPTVTRHARSMFGGSILRGATIFGRDENGALMGGETGPEAVVGVNSLNQQIRDAVKDGMSGIASGLAGAMQTRQPIYVVLDTGALVGAMGPAMDAELTRMGDWKGGGRA